jgi:hypothetical protein
VRTAIVACVPVPQVMSATVGNTGAVGHRGGERCRIRQNWPLPSEGEKKYPHDEARLHSG